MDLFSLTPRENNVSRFSIGYFIFPLTMIFKCTLIRYFIISCLQKLKINRNHQQNKGSPIEIFVYNVLRKKIQSFLSIFLTPFTQKRQQTRTLRLYCLEDCFIQWECIRSTASRLNLALDFFPAHLTNSYALSPIVNGFIFSGRR